MTSNPNEKVYLTIDEFCHRFGVGRTKAYALLNSGQLPAVKVGVRTLIPVEAAEAWATSLPKWEPARGHRRGVSR